MKYLSILFIGALLLSCEEEQLSADDLQQQMQAIEGQIEAITSKDCTENAQCKAVAIGRKPCGGPTHYIVYGSVTNEAELNDLIEQYNTLNQTYNEATNAYSDCAIVNPPQLECSSGTCVELTTTN